MSYAIKKNGSSWRAINGPEDIATDEIFNEDQPTLIVDYSAIARAERDARLAATDWTQLPDVPEATSTLWRPYRQALRDVPEQAGFPQTITWPTQPA